MDINAAVKTLADQKLHYESECKKLRQDLDKARSHLMALLEWEQYMGGFDSTVWKDARKLVHGRGKR